MGTQGHSATRLHSVVHWKQFHELLDEHQEAEFLDALINSLRAATKTARAAPFQPMLHLKLLNLRTTPSALAMPRPGQLPTGSTPYCAGTLSSCAERVGLPSAPLRKRHGHCKGVAAAAHPHQASFTRQTAPPFPGHHERENGGPVVGTHCSCLEPILDPTKQFFGGSRT